MLLLGTLACTAGNRDLFVPGFGELLVNLKSNIADPTRFVISGIEYLDKVYDPACNATVKAYFRVVR